MMVRVFLTLFGCSMANAQLMLFVDHTLFANFSSDLELTVNPPAITPHLAVFSTEPWESYAVDGYHSLVAANATRGVDKHRLYYDCIEGKGGPFPSSPHARRVCLAESTDGLVWSKPNLGIFDRNGSTANNILLEDSGVSVFYDQSPAAGPSTRWKMICSKSAYASPDGLRWTKLPFATVAEDDTKPTAYWDPHVQKYVVIVRRDLPPPAGKSGDVMRYLGRCETSNISDWQQEVPAGASGCPVVFGPDALDPDHVDVYTNSWTPYPSIDDPAPVHLYFPSFFAHFPSYDGAGAPYGFDNDGILDIRLLVSRDGKHIGYAPARNGRAPFVALGPTSCGPGATAPSVMGGWCDPNSPAQARTAPDTSGTYMASGWVPSADGSEVYLMASAQPETHGAVAQTHVWGKNTGVRVLRLRKHGFVSVNAPYTFHGPAPTFTTVAVRVPTGCAPPTTTRAPARAGCAFEFPGGLCPLAVPAAACRTDADCAGAARSARPPACHGVRVACRFPMPRTTRGFCTTGAAGGTLCAANITRTRTTGGVQLYVNARTSVVGSVAVGVEDSSSMFSLANANPIVGNNLAAAASWGHDGGAAFTSSLSPLAGTDVAFKVAMRDAKLFSLELKCAE